MQGKAYELAVAGGRLLVSTDAGCVYCFAADSAAAPAPPAATVHVPAPGGKAALSLGPRLQFTTTDSAVCWQTTEPLPTEVFWTDGPWTPDGAPAQRVAATRIRLTRSQRRRRLKKRSMQDFPRSIGPCSRASSPTPSTPIPFWRGQAPILARGVRHLLQFQPQCASRRPRPSRSRPLPSGRRKNPRPRAERNRQRHLPGAGKQSGPTCLEFASAATSPLRIIGVETDEQLVDASRQSLREAGIYGARVAIHRVENFRALPLVENFANLIVFDRLLADGKCDSSETEITRLLRPGGGLAILGCRAGGETAGPESIAWHKVGKPAQRAPASGRTSTAPRPTPPSAVRPWAGPPRPTTWWCSGSAAPALDSRSIATA